MTLKGKLDFLTQATFLNTVVFHSELDSTNRLARDSSGEVNHPALFICDLQTAGKGRGSNQWLSKTGNLTFTFTLAYSDNQLSTLANEFDCDLGTLLSPMTALAILRMLETQLVSAKPELTYKWPNDVYGNGKKLCGILVERVRIPSATNANVFVVGCGINVNVSTLDFDNREELSKAISCVDITGSDCDLVSMMNELTSTFQSSLEQLTSGKLDLTKQLQKVSFLQDKQVTVNIGSRNVSGVVRGLSENIGLEMETKSGLQTLHSGSIVEFN